mgnify:CR=1 FL=1
MGFSPTFGARRFPKGERKALWCARWRIPLATGTNAPTPARTVGLPPRRGQYFLSKRKKVPKKARGTATTGKSPLLPIFERGSSQCRAQTSWIAITCYRARSCSLLSSFKKGKAFSLRCLSPLCSPAVGARHTQIAVLGMLRRSLDIFATQKTSVNIESRWPFSASHEACRRMAVFSIQLTRSCIRPASREACCRAAVKLKPSHFSSMSLRASAVTGAGL